MVAGTIEATVNVCLWNTGEEAHRPQEFGDIIEIERRISDRGASSIKLKSRQGKVIATGIAEVKSLMAHFQIDAANPVVCLTQVPSDFLVFGMWLSNPQACTFACVLRAFQLPQRSLDALKGKWLGHR